MFVHPTQDGMVMVVQRCRSVIRGDNGMYLSSCVSVPSTVDGMVHFA